MPFLTFYRSNLKYKSVVYGNQLYVKMFIKIARLKGTK